MSGSPAGATADYKAAVSAAILEYLDSEDLDELARSITELAQPQLAYLVVKRAITVSLDHGEREKELVSRAISSLYSTVFTMEQIQDAFRSLFAGVSELRKDAPDVDRVLANFLSRAVIDECVAPAFLADPALAGDAPQILDHAKALLSMRHNGPRLEHVWALGANAPLPDLKRSVSLLLEEFLTSQDLVEAAACLKELEIPHFHHEVVKRGMVLAMDKHDSDCEMMSTLFTYLFAQGVVTSKQFDIGFARVKESMGDIQLDDPQAPAMFAGFLKRAIADGVLDPEFTFSA